ncbi:unnamed protein product [Linum tenue]|uniref:Uncharacterized protein n=1 Tax=Linum tenue TaxID=586396 RepID=A0AAV0JEX1_9ROSI|nr:unnamed protein product [Linum tenue]
MADSKHSTSPCCDALDKSQVFDTTEMGRQKQEKGIKFSDDEESLIIRMYKLVGERWHLIAGRIPGRTAQEIEKYWNSRYSTSE